MTMEIRRSPAGARVEITRKRTWSRVGIDRHATNLPDATTEQQVAFRAAATKWMDECRRAGIRVAAVYESGGGKTYQAVQVPRGREDEALGDLFAVEAMEPVR